MAEGVADDAGLVLPDPVPVELQRFGRSVQVRHGLVQVQICETGSSQSQLAGDVLPEQPITGISRT